MLIEDSMHIAQFYYTAEIANVAYFISIWNLPISWRVQVVYTVQIESRDEVRIHRSIRGLVSTVKPTPRWISETMGYYWRPWITVIFGAK